MIPGLPKVKSADGQSLDAGHGQSLAPACQGLLRFVPCSLFLVRPLSDKPAARPSISFRDTGDAALGPNHLARRRLAISAHIAREQHPTPNREPSCSLPHSGNPFGRRTTLSTGVSPLPPPLLCLCRALLTWRLPLQAPSLAPKPFEAIAPRPSFDTSFICDAGREHLISREQKMAEPQADIQSILAALGKDQYLFSIVYRLRPG